MRILFLISNMKHGRGGHYHSLNHISRKLGEQHEVQIVSVGPVRGGVLEENPYFFKHIHFDGLNLFKVRTEIKGIDRNFRPDVFHCFDSSVYNLLRIFISSRKRKIVLNQCGGANPIEFPHVKSLILFSLENQDWFNSQDKYRDTDIYLIPNRVSKIDLGEGFSEYKKDASLFSLVRICRISRNYQKSVEDSIMLIVKLKQSGIQNIRLYVIGTIEEDAVYEYLRKKSLHLGDSIIFVTDDRYTKEASKMLYLADAVIGVGRSAMEAASLGVPLLAINAKGNYPVLLDKENFMDAFKTNFSERNVFARFEEAINLKNISRLVRDQVYLEEQRIFAKHVFDKYFDIDKVGDSYTLVYERSLFSRRNLLNDILIIARSFRRFYFYSRLRSSKM